MSFLTDPRTPAQRPGSRLLARRAAGIALSGAALLAVPVPAAAQIDALTDRCATTTAPASTAEAYCHRIAHGIGIAQPGIAIAAIGGNPVPGTASTLGTRIGRMPRVSATARVTNSFVQLPPIRTADATTRQRFSATGVHVDAAVGVYPGVALLPTVGGVGSVDLLGSLGVVRLPGGRAFASSPMSWALGARLGLARESFTLPGISLSGSYRRLGGIEYGDEQLARSDAHFTIDGTSVLSLRGAVSKRLFSIATAAGIGHDRHASNVAWRIAAQPPAAQPVELAERGFRTTYNTGFVNASWTTLILNVVGELGIRSGGRTSTTRSKLRAVTERRSIYAGLATRIAL